MDSVSVGTGCSRSGRTWESRRSNRGESRREQQFYRYYGPFRQMTDYGPVFCDVRDPQARKQHKAISCPDKTLTAFCQLGALRMKARRCLIFFFDINHAYIMAEATRTLSLQDNGTHDAGDQLWMGHSVIPRDVACCEVTVDLPSFSATAATKGDCRQSAFIVDDLTKHPELKDRPYVTEHPNGRYYAGVPITTPTGTNIGAYCILDDKPREGISEQDLLFMRDMSQTVMAHLETVRALSECQQSNQMMTGLGTFVRDALDSKRQPPPATNMPLNDGVMKTTVQHRIPDALIDPITTPGAQEPSQSTRSEYFDKVDVGSEDQRRDQPGSFAVPTHESPVYLRPDFWDAPKSARAIRNRVTRPPVLKPKPVDKLRSAYQRAAGTLCQSLDIDGVAFLDASVGTFGGLSEAVDSTETSTCDSSDDSAPFQSESDSATDKPVFKDKRTCPILGCAQSVRDGAARTIPRRPAKKVTERMIRDLMRHNPNGKIWLYDEDGMTYSEDGNPTDDSVDGETPSRPKSPVNHKERSARRDRRIDAENMQLAFPGARCVALHGIWDYTRRRWSVGGLYWTYDPFRVLSVETEMHFVAAFCDVIVAETRRLEVLGSDEAKSDFISSVSHELRSPLHGILGSAEILAECRLDNTASTLVEQIESCGNSLLEIIDHLLDFGNLKNQRLKKGSVKSSKIGRRIPPSIPSASANNDLAALNTDVAFDEVTEEAVVSSVYSFYYHQNIRDRTNVPVIFDIDHPTDTGWRCQLATGGWKRVCMNLVTNALKYTPVGYVRVSLKQRSRPGSRRRFDAVLSVSDSGKGMSKEFQKNHLFHDFSQEDTLSSGLGLGMHMVSRMVHAMGGKIEVTSDQNGTGTRVVVSVPLEHNQNRHDHGKCANGVRTTSANRGEGLKISLITEVHPSPSTREEDLIATASAMAITSVEKNCKFLGAQLERCMWRACNPCDLKVIMEADLGACLQMMRDTKGEDDRDVSTPLLIVCNTSLTAQTLRELWVGDSLSSSVAAEHIALPCAIKQLSRAIECALQLQKELVGAAGAATHTSNAPKAHELAVVDEPSYSAQASDQSAEWPSQFESSFEEATTMSTLPPRSLLLRDAGVISEGFSLSNMTLNPSRRNQSSTLHCSGSLHMQPVGSPSTGTIVPTVTRDPVGLARVLGWL